MTPERLRELQLVVDPAPRHRAPDTIEVGLRDCLLYIKKLQILEKAVRACILDHEDACNTHQAWDPNEAECDCAAKDVKNALRTLAE